MIRVTQLVLYKFISTMNIFPPDVEKKIEGYVTDLCFKDHKKKLTKVLHNMLNIYYRYHLNVNKHWAIRYSKGFYRILVFHGSRPNYWAYVEKKSINGDDQRGRFPFEKWVYVGLPCEMFNKFN